MTISSANEWGPFSLAGKRAAVTGAAKGIGLGIVKRYLEAGSRVLLTDNDEGDAQQAVQSLGGPSDYLQAATVDVAAIDAGQRLVDACVSAFGGIDILVNNAGIFPYRPMLDCPRDVFERVLDVNLVGLAYCSQAAARRMVEQGSGGAIVNIASIDSVHPSMVGLAAYDASKGGVLMFTRAFALEAATHGIRVNAIAPGGVTTPGAAHFMNEIGAATSTASGGAGGASSAFGVPLGRMGEPDDIATVAVFLASDAARYMTGQLVVVDGGVLIS
jgi:2-deoxy-D-gluconate 3-dehydrogenase